MVHIGLGGNIGDPRAAMAAALQALSADREIELVAVSALYRTPPWGPVEQPDFFNAAATILTRLEPRAFLDRCLEIELSLKRVRDVRWGPRLIDIDILVFGDREIDEDDLTVPHPRMLERAFVMLPLAEIAPRLIVGGETVLHWAERVDAAGVERLTDDGEWWRAA